jgi:hypothetical protein
MRLEFFDRKNHGYITGGKTFVESNPQNVQSGHSCERTASWKKFHPGYGLIPAAQEVEYYEISTYWWFISIGPNSRRDDVAEIPETILIKRKLPMNADSHYRGGCDL